MIGTVCWLKSSWGCTLVHLCGLNFLTVWWLDFKNKCSERERKRDLGRSHISSYDLVLEDVQCFFCHILLFEEVTMFHSCSKEGNMDSTTPWRNVKVTLQEVCVGWGIYWYHHLWKIQTAIGKNFWISKYKKTFQNWRTWGSNLKRTIKYPIQWMKQNHTKSSH